MDSLFPSPTDMQAINDLYGAFVGYGLGLGGCVCVLGYLIAWLTGIFKEV